MICAMIRMFGSRTVVILAEPTHPALAAAPFARSGCSAAICDRASYDEAICELSRSLAVQILGAPPDSFRLIAG